MDVPQDVASIVFYDFNGNSITVADIKNEWNQRNQEDEKAEAAIKSFQIININDTSTNKEKRILLASTNKNSVKTATELSQFKDGFKLSNQTITCINSSYDLNVKLSNGELYCANDEKKYDSCTKIVSQKRAIEL